MSFIQKVIVSNYAKVHYGCGKAMPCAVYSYCKMLNIRGIKFSRFNENNILAYFNFDGHDIPWFQMVKKSDVNCNFFS